MSERIKELWVQAGYHADVYAMLPNMEKFAELLIDEVYSFLLNPSLDDEPWPSRQETRQHFGIGQ